MPGHVGFEVVRVSGLEDYEISEELLLTKEWVSSNSSDYPKVIIIRLNRQSNVERIQILCHRIFIPSKVDLFYSNEDIHKSADEVEFHPLGEVIFKNRRDDVGKHELKTIYIASDVTFLKFEIGQNYDNPKLNPYDQVGIVNIAIIGRPVPLGQTAVIGDELRQETKMMKGMTLLQRYNTTDVKRDDYPPDLLELLVVIEKNKELAVKNENYPLATKCKAAAKQLTIAMGVLKDKEDQKREAIELEDYEQAEVLTKDIQKLRSETLKNIDVTVLEEQTIVPMHTTRISTQSVKDDKPSKKLFEPLTPCPPSDRSKNGSSHTPPEPPNRDALNSTSTTNTSSSRPSSKSRMPRSSSTSTIPSNGSNNKFMQKENTVVPAANKRRRSITSSTASFDNGQIDEETLFGQINPNDHAYARKLKNTFGLEMVYNVYSKNWEHRRRALIDTHKKLSQVPQDKASSYLSVALPILVKGLRDKLFNVYSESLNLLQYIVLTYIPAHKLSKAYGQKIVDKTYYILISRTGDTISDSRFGSQTYDAIGVLHSGDPQITRLYLTRYMEPFDISGSVRSDQGKATIVSKAIQQLGAPNKSLNLTESSICKFANICMQHLDPEVRNIGKSLVVSIYTNGTREEVRSLLPPKRSSLAKSHLIRGLFAELEAIDRSSSNSSNSNTSSKRSSVDNNKPSKSVRLVLDRSRHPSDDDPVDYEKLCMHCGLLSPNLDKDGLQEHYDRHCPMLFKCPHCLETDEVCHMKEHYLNKCKKRELYKECQKCNQPIERRMFKRHTDDQNCQMPRGDIGRCLLCQSDVTPNNDVGWRNHLMKQCLTMWDAEPITECTTEIAGLKIGYEKYGRGPNRLLFICGAVGCYKKDYPDHVLRNFDPELVTIIAIDPPGYGTSRPPDRVQEVQRCSKDAKVCLELMQQLEMTPFGVVGWSEGGRTAIHVAEQGQAKVNAMILIATSTKVDFRGSLAFKGMRNVDQWLPGSREPYLQYYTRDELRVQWAALCDVVQNVYDNLGGRFPSDYSCQQIKCPTILLHGGMDRFCMDPKLMIQSLSNTKPKPLLEIQALGGHDFHTKYARWFANKVQYFLKTTVNTPNGNILDLDMKTHIKKSGISEQTPPHCPLPMHRPTTTTGSRARPAIGSTPSLGNRISTHGRHLNNSKDGQTDSGIHSDSLDDLSRREWSARQSRNSISSTGSANISESAALQFYLQKRESRASISSSIISRPISAEGELFRHRSTSSYSSRSVEPTTRNSRVIQVLSNSDFRQRSATTAVNENNRSVKKLENGDGKTNSADDVSAPSQKRSIPPQASLNESPKRSDTALRPRSQYIGDTVWQVDETVFCGGMESVMNQNLLCRLQVEYVVDLTGLDEDHLPHNRRTECPCLCARKTQHTRMTMAISIYDDDKADNPRQDFISFFEDFMNLISRAKSCGKCVLVHSVKGRNRAPAFIAAYLMHNKHISRVQAISKVGEMMSRMRPGLQISDTLQRALMRWQTALGIRSNDTTNNLEQQLAVPLFTVKRTAWT